MEIITIIIPAVDKIITNRKVKAIMAKTAIAVEVVLEIAAVVVEAMVEVMVAAMEETVTTVEAEEDTTVVTPVEDMAEVKVVVEEVDMAIVEDMATALVEDTTVAVAVVVITKEATVTVTAAVMEWSYKKIPFSYLEWIHRFRKKKFVNTLELLDSSSTISVLGNQKYGCIKTKILENQKEKPRSHTTIRMPHSPR